MTISGAWAHAPFEIDGDVPPPRASLLHLTLGWGKPSCMSRIVTQSSDRHSASGGYQNEFLELRQTENDV